jgi:cell wall-associated NlpC family hydrolase
MDAAEPSSALAQATAGPTDEPDASEHGRPCPPGALCPEPVRRPGRRHEGETESRRVMATPSTSSRPASRRAVLLSRRIALGLAALAAVALSPVAASATPEPTTAHEAGALMAARAHDLEKVTERFDLARDQLAAQQARAKAAQARFRAAQAALGTARRQVRGIARSAYTGNGGSFAALLTSRSATDFVDRVTTLEAIAGRQNAVLGKVVAAGKAAAAAEVAAQRSVAQAKATFSAVAAQQAALQAQISRYQADFNRLSAREKQATLAAGEGVVRASRSEVRAPIAPAGPVVASSRAAQIAVDTALAQRGKAYVWAAAGPGTFDCSGLMQYAYAAAGIGLPHSSLMQSQMGMPVSRSQLQPGDLVFYYSPVSHVGMYIGNGQIVNAPTAGDVVKVVGLDAVGPPTAMRRIAG